MKKDKLVNMIIQYEDGSLPVDMTQELFAKLIQTGKAWKLQGNYTRMAKALIKEGYISKQGKILKRF
jgi:hypothetical protein